MTAGKTFVSPGSSRGLSMVEMLVALVIGMVIIAAVLVSYIGSGTSGRNSSALSEMTENASVALGVMRNYIAMADYGAPTGVNSSGVTQAYTGRAVFGCDGGEFKADTLTALNAMTKATNCDTTGSDAIGIAYQADAANTMTTLVSGVPTPTDCLGQTLSLSGGIYLNEARFFVEDGQLYCRGSGDLTNARPLVDNINDLQVSYGLGGTTTATAKQVVQYLNASDVDTAGAWGRVLNVRICVVVRSTDQVQDSTGTAYRDCSFAEQTPNDRFMYRAFTSTVVLHNRTGGL